MTPLSMLGMSVLAHLREDNIDTLVVHEAAPGAWHADIILKDVPTGVPDTLGTPVADPLPSKEEAEEAARNLLTGLMAEIYTAKHASRDTVQKDVRVFRIFEVEFFIPGDAIDSMLEGRKEIFAGFPGTPADFALHLLAEVCEQIVKDGNITQKDWEAADPGLRDRGVVAMLLLLSEDIFQFPPRPVPPPQA